ncbi:MAG: tRNA-specific adenosine deaminase [Bacteroidetes bacterium GWE2_42_24]|nr:MAG: tRNA-specific adenosine deaminase [Bacteroidetes bacterium GWE2_42_24]OFY25414.1 MAG: tRNA-specific adenosine deaminase [Bacteroidetes bacterium GWF2_43_11]PKP26952.1 MAG: tRNA-specific adenosine deaminase [Bacteroidetes bacterium HGW-Bacteroidetes-22]
MQKREFFMREAIRLASENIISAKGGPFGCVVVRNGEIIARAANSVTSSNDPTAHAEVNAIRLACKFLNAFQLSDCEIYTSCEPCPMCLGALYWARPKAIYFGASKTDAADSGFDDSFIYNQLELSSAERSIPQIQLLNEEATVPFKEWKTLLNKIEY